MAGLRPLLPMKCIAGEALRQVLLWARLPASERETKAEAFAQARATRQAEKAAEAIAQIRDGPPSVEMARIDSDEYLVEEEAEEFENGSRAQDVERPADAEHQHGLEDAVDFDVQEMQHFAELAPRPTRFVVPRRCLACSNRCGLAACLAVVFLLPTCGGIWACIDTLRPKNEDKSSVMEPVLLVAAIIGGGYWLAAFALLVAVIALQPVAREPKRGPDGFYKIRSLREDERCHEEVERLRKQLTESW